MRGSIEGELSVGQARDLLMELSDDAGSPEGDGGAPGPGSDAGKPDVPADEARPSDDAAGAKGAQGMEAGAAPEDSQGEAGVGLAEETARSYAEGSVGLGVDIVEVQRMAAILKRSPSFAEHVFSQAEQDYCNGKANPATHYALRFAAKEAVVKALGTGFAQGVGVRDVEVERTASGKPAARLSGRALQIAEEQGVRELSLSLSYTHTDAVACAMAVTDASIRESAKRKDPAEELARQFKEVRGMLDEL